LKSQLPLRQHHHYAGLFFGGMLGAATWALLHQSSLVATVASLLATGSLPATLAIGLGLMVLGAILGYLVSLASKDIISNRATSMATA
jgi:vacuolar-type H+-ATPase subunit I/STV1